MGNYRIYRGVITGNGAIIWKQTSYIGTKQVIKKILRALSKSKYHIYDMRNEI